MDFESGIDTWVIDKEDSDGSHTSLELSRKETCDASLELTTMDKENIKHFSTSTERKVLRCFRIHKSVGHQELSGNLENDKRKSLGDKDDSPQLNEKPTLESAQTPFNDREFPKSKYQNSSSSSSVSSFNEYRKDKEHMSSEEISVMLSEVDGSSDSNQEKNRERLLSIENVSVLVDNKDKGGDSLQTLLKLSFSCPLCNCEYRSLDELTSHEAVHKRTSLPVSSHQLSEQAVHQVERKSLLRSNGSTWKQSDFLDTFKTHLIRQGVIPTSVTSRAMTITSRGSKAEESKLIKPATPDQKPYNCNVCNYYCSELLIFKTHQIMFHSDSKVLLCEYCNYETSLCANLVTHIRVHFQLDCPHCDYQCSLKNSLDAHLRRYHPGNNFYKCKKCDYNCKSKSKFQKHLQLHTVTSKYQCGDCNLVFASKKILKIHIKSHLVVKKSFKCEKCKLCFSQKHNLKLHMKSHEDLYSCDTCNSKFTRKNYLKIHMKVHTSRESYKCEKCDSLFTGKNYLKLHMRIHVPKYLKCQHCPFQCTDSSELSKHICIDKLYDVQRRSLNFQKEDNSEEVNKTLNKVLKEEKSNRTSKIQRAGVKETASEKVISTKLTYKKRKFLKNRSKLLTLRQNLPSRNNLSVGIKDDKKIDELFKCPNKTVEPKQALRDVNCGDKRARKARTNGAYKTNLKQNMWVVTNKKDTVIPYKFRSIKRIKKKDLSRGLNSAKLMFSKKTSAKDLLVEPVRFNSSSFVECYYQYEQSTVEPEHLETHVRQSTILSCRFCKYKTNSEQLLRQHTAKNHTWDPRLVKNLFR